MLQYLSPRFANITILGGLYLNIFSSCEQIIDCNQLLGSIPTKYCKKFWFGKILHFFSTQNMLQYLSPRCANITIFGGLFLNMFSSCQQVIHCNQLLCSIPTKYCKKFWFRKILHFFSTQNMLQYLSPRCANITLFGGFP